MAGGVHQTAVTVDRANATMVATVRGVVMRLVPRAFKRVGVDLSLAAAAAADRGPLAAGAVCAQGRRSGSCRAVPPDPPLPPAALGLWARALELQLEAMPVGNSVTCVYVFATLLRLPAWALADCLSLLTLAQVPRRMMSLSGVLGA
jgi:hypothetical protein